MEAAFLLPVFLTVLLLLIQPVCLLYTRGVMESAASETARIMVTTKGTSTESLEAFALRRLSAVPDLSIFHVGGPLMWDIELAPAKAEDGSVCVAIEGFARPLPILGVFAPAWGEVNDVGDVRLRAEVAYKARPSWLEGSYDSWKKIWG